MEEFTASNGITLSFDEDGRFVYSKDGLDPLLLGQSFSGGWWGFTANSQNSVALAEYYRAKADERLGLWRSKEYPEWLVAIEADEDGDHAVWPEGDPGKLEYSAGPDAPPHGATAEEVFKEFKRATIPPVWRDAKEGEVWVITYNDQEFPAIFQAGMFRDHGGSWDMGRITSARKIYPAE